MADDKTNLNELSDKEKADLYAKHLEDMNKRSTTSDGNRG